MQRTLLSPWVWLALGLGLLFGPSCAPARSAPPVQRDTRSITSDPYPDAASELGFREWGSPDDNQQVVRATVRLDAERMRLLIMLPPQTPVTQAEQWLQGLAAAMKWQDVDLRSTPQPERLYLRADVRKWVHNRAFGQSEARFDPKLLAIELRKLTSQPALLGIRLVGAELQSASIPPKAGGHSDGHYFMFYRLGDLSQDSGPLTLDYGIPRRWLAAGAAGLLLWLLFPLVALYAVRHYLNGQREIEARHRLTLYRRWQRGVLVAPFVLAMGALFLSRFWFLGYFGTGFALATPVLIFLPGVGFGLAARLIGLPLERAAWPQRAKLPWYRMASTEIWLAGIVLGVVVGTGLMTVWTLQIRAGSGAQSRWPSLIPLLLVLGAILCTGIRTWRRKRGPLPNEAEAPQELTEPIRVLTRRLQVPIEHVRLRPAREGLDAGTVYIYGSLAVIGREISETLDAEQVAALVAAEALDQPRSRFDRLISTGVSLGTFAMAALALMGNWLRLNSPAQVTTLLPLFAAIGPLMMVLVVVYRRQGEKRSEAADLQAAEALPDPLRMLLAFKMLEEVQVETAGLDLGSARQSSLIHRRERLARRLGLE